MLAQNFMTATDLGITDPELDALIKVLGMLERGEIPEEKFRMHTVGRPECGSAGCLLGWMKTVDHSAGVSLEIKWCSSHRFDQIFSPNPPIFFQRICREATTATAAIALRSYLSTGKANWAEALA
jgi:hypothetical protein